MVTPLYSTDIIPLTSRPTLTVMDDGDYFVILDTSTGKISKILRTNIQKALNISYDNTTSELTAETVQAALDELVVNLGSSDSAILALAGRLDTLEGSGYTEGSLKSHEDRLDTLEGEGEGSVAKAIDDAVSPLAEVVDTNRLYSDSQYLELKAQADAQALEIQASRAELYNGYKILQFGSTDIIGKGTKADYSAIDVSANVVDGKLSMEQKGLTIRNIVNGASIANLGTVTFATILNDKYYDTLNKTIITGDGTEMSAINSSGATANMAIYHLKAHGLNSITDTAILAQLLPYVDGTKNVGKMGMRVVGKNLFDTSKVIKNKIPDSVEASVITFKTFVGLDTAVIPVKAGMLISGSDFRNSSGDSLRHVFVDEDYNNKGFGTLGNNITVPDGATYLLNALSPVYYGVARVNLGSTALPYEPYQEQLTFLPAIGNSLPNGVADSVKTVADGWEHTKRISTPVSVASGVAVNTTNYPTAKNGGQWVNELTAGGTEIGVVGTDSTTGVGMLRFELATPITTHYDLPLPTSGKTIHRFAGEEKIALYGTGLTFSENVLSVLSAVKFVAGVMTDITSLATITDDTVTFSGVNATDVVYVKVEHDVDRPLGILEHTPAVSNTASRLAAIEAWIAAQGA